MSIMAGIFISLWGLLWIGAFIGAIILFFVVLAKRMKEKEIEAKKHKDYTKY